MVSRLFRKYLADLYPDGWTPMVVTKEGERTS